MLALLLLLPLALAAPLPRPNLPSAQLLFRSDLKQDRAARTSPHRRENNDNVSDTTHERISTASAASSTDASQRSVADHPEAHLDPRLFASERDSQQAPAHSMPITDFMVSDDITWNMAHALGSLPHPSKDANDTSKRGLSIAQSIANLSTKFFHRFSRQARSSTNSIDGERDAAEMRASDDGSGV